MTTFADFYSQFPRKKARGDAEKAWQQAIKKGHDPDAIMAGLRRNLADLQRREPQFIPYPATWLRSEGFFDEPDPITQRNPARRTTWDAARDINARLDHLNASFGLPQLAKH
ncbi:hypothetical protein [Rhizobium hidalgonense]|uniref:hypothetical protein n=1 Tax=Rhizobium hidalgonense TaxID=1538159 RepID=UPI002872617B|nr:hypothetical protein [Rhizobium hidalgonense]MDR9813092.1 hypothetical protein [Rhizobium hidalgonense]